MALFKKNLILLLVFGNLDLWIWDWMYSSQTSHPSCFFPLKICIVNINIFLRFARWKGVFIRKYWGKQKISFTLAGGRRFGRVLCNIHTCSSLKEVTDVILTSIYSVTRTGGSHGNKASRLRRWGFYHRKIMNNHDLKCIPETLVLYFRPLKFY